MNITRFNYWVMVVLERGGQRLQKVRLPKSNKCKQGGGGGGVKLWSFGENVIIEWPL